MLVPLASAITELAPIKQNECVQLPQTCATCTYNNLTIVQYPNSTFALSGEYEMTKNGMNYNYTYCNTSALGTYFVDGHGDVDGTDTGWGGYTFDVNGSGQTVTQDQVTLIIIGIIVFILVSGFFFLLSYLFKYPAVKIFFMALSIITMIIIIGIITSNASVYLAEFPNIVNIYDNYYIMIVILSGGAMLALLTWLIYYSFTLFNKSRGIDIPDYDKDD
jgi:hypothetical protein